MRLCMAVHFNVVVLFGPPFSGKTRHCLKKYVSAGFERICPTELFLANKNLGMRDISVQISRLLEKGKKVVIDDENSSVKTRKSYINFIRRKFPRSKFQLVKLCPLGGYFQCMWSREFVLASSCDVKNICKDHHIAKWYDKDDPDSCSFNNTYVDEPDASEGFCIDDEESFLTAVTPVKFEVPALFLQWEGVSPDDDPRPIDRISAVCKQWEAANPCGRIFIICDGQNVSKGLVNVHDEESSVKTFSKQLVFEVPIPVYVFQLHQPIDVGRFCSPPNPGMLAYLQKRHCLDLHSRSTLYLYDSSGHKNMAEKAGVRHIKVVTGHAAKVPTIPPMLQTLVLESEGDDRTPEIPLYDVIGEFRNNYVVQDLPCGRREFLFAEDTSMIERYQTLYSENATPLAETDSRIEKLRLKLATKRTLQLSYLQDMQPSSTDSESASTKTASSRDLPKWMLGKRKSGSVSSLQRSDSTSSTEVKSRKRTTVYLMTEKELVECAKEVLKQAGREDILQRIENEKNIREDFEESKKKPSNEENEFDADISTLIPEAASPHRMENTSSKVSLDSVEGKVQVKKSEMEREQCVKELPDKDIVVITQEDGNISNTLSQLCTSESLTAAGEVKVYGKRRTGSNSVKPSDDVRSSTVCTNLGDIGAMLDALFDDQTQRKEKVTPKKQRFNLRNDSDDT
ncbi:uncharacterized protein LOC121384112 isoform X2 [Gigantopelta aegis]|uniref:uncharacterized protein LOC121384112 isoform X2 n=1 Tax=Gigantopelta aegis TaxID=1735272 RepID=UPI001B888E28|nr:uncharacterized protein LOC121384112 isoform X2 [Gigantopelta aegis]